MERGATFFGELAPVERGATFFGELPPLRHLEHRALCLLSLSEAARRGIRTAQRGLVGYRTIEEAEADRERFRVERLREADRG